MTADRMLLAVERIADDRRFARRFRRDPERALRRYRLVPEQVSAIKAGDAASLAAHGVDIAGFAAGRRRGIRSRHKRRMAAMLAVVAGSLGMSAPPAAAARWAGRRLTIRIDGIWRLGEASERSGVDLKGKVEHVEVPTDGAPGKGRPFHLEG